MNIRIEIVGTDTFLVRQKYIMAAVGCNNSAEITETLERIRYYRYVPQCDRNISAEKNSILPKNIPWCVFPP